jgi:hypothetical protein
MESKAVLTLPQLGEAADGRILRDFAASLRALAKSLVPHIYPYGLLHLVMDNALFLKLPGAELPDIADNISLPKPVAADMSKVHKMYEMHELRRQQILAAQVTLLKSIQSSLSSSALESLISPEFMINIKTIPEHIEFIKKRYSVSDTEYVQQLMSDLYTPISKDSCEGLQQHFTSYDKTLTLLKEIGQPVASLQQQIIFVDTLGSSPSMMDAYTAYATLNPINRTVVAATDYIMLRLRNPVLPTLGLGFGGAIQRRANSAAVALAGTAALATAAAVAAAPAANVNTKPKQICGKWNSTTGCLAKCPHNRIHRVPKNQKEEDDLESFFSRGALIRKP